MDIFACAKIFDAGFSDNFRNKKRVPKLLTKEQLNI